MSAIFREGSDRVAEAETKATLLAVDDNPENLTILGELLQPTYRVLAATSGERALELAASEPRPNLILLDVIMPDMDGYAVLAKLRENPATHDIPVIFVTAMDAAEDEQRGLELGAADYITKPLRPPIVLARVRTQLELKQARDRLRNQNAFLEAEVARRVAENELILASAAEGIFGVTAEGIINFINPSAAAMLGYECIELLGKPAHATLHHSHPDGTFFPAEECAVVMALVGGVAIRNSEEILWRKDGSQLPVEFSSSPVRRGDHVLGAVVTFMDISERKRYLEQLERRSNYDDLTGLPNRNLLHDRLSHAVGRCSQDGCPAAVAVIDIDRFREINDVLGPHTGDQVLQAIAHKLNSLPVQPDTLARVTADEFVALLNDEREASDFAQAVLESLAKPLCVGERELHISVSVGIAVAPKDGLAAEALLRNATAAMYKAKNAGGNVFRFYATEMNAKSLERLDMANELHQALTNRELVLHYQPQLSMRNGEIIGCEALLRWQHPTRGLVPPAQFIPLAEDTGMIVAIGEWVLRTACLQSKQWQDAGLPPLTMAVNISAHQFAAQDVVTLAANILKETGLDPNTLELELTESTVMADAETFIQAMEKLKDLHVTLSIDDFGTGFSSLSYLKRFAIDRLKIDMSFVQDVTRDANSAAIAVAIISLAHNLNLSVIAEGVETEGQLKFLRARDCDEMQGFYFSPAVAAVEFEQMLRERRRLVFPPGVERPTETILLVDDEPAILSSLRRLLRREGYQILTAGSGLEGLEVMSQHQVGVVISDSRMPEMNGAEFLKRVGNIYPDTVRMMLSGYTDLKAVTEAVNTGELYRFLTKPWDDHELLETIRGAFHHYETRRQQRSETISTAAGGGA